MTKYISAFILAFSFMALPSMAQAATYAFVNQSGNVSTVVANDPNTAIATAFNIHPRSGVMLLNTTGDYNIVGNNVSGV